MFGFFLGNYNFNKTNHDKIFTAEELLALLKSTDYNQIMETKPDDQKIISDEDMEILLDRSSMMAKREDMNTGEEREAFKILPSTVDGIVL